MGSFLNKIWEFVLRQETRDADQAYDMDLFEFYMSDRYDQLKQRYAAFHQLMAQNNAIMDALNALQEQVHSRRITVAGFRRQVAQLLDRLRAFAESLAEMSGDKYMWLVPIVAELRERIEKKLAAATPEAAEPLYLLEQVSASMADEVGAKAANLGDVQNVLHLPVPRGMVFTFRAFETLVSHNRLQVDIDPLMANLTLEDDEGIWAASQRIQRAILEAEIPPGLEGACASKLDELQDIPSFAVRSSAMGEDGADSYAGQFRSVLNVPREGVLDAYKEVCASLFGERVIRYRLAKGIPATDDLAMAVLVVEMVPAAASGVLYSLDPRHPGSRRCMVTGVLGLGPYAVDGTVQPDVYLLDRTAGGAVVEQTVGRKHLRLTADTNRAGVRSDEVPDELQQAPCLSEESLHTLYEFSRVIEKRFDAPQDVEWAVDAQGGICILQARPLAVSRQVCTPAVEVEEEPVLVGKPLTCGVAAGPVALVRDKHTATLPPGSVLVLKTMDPEFAKLIPTAGGLIVETGSAATHLATVAREFHLPALIDAFGAAAALEDGEIVTLDAHRGTVYRGRVESLLETQDGEENDPAAPACRDLPLIDDVLKDISPLTLTDIPDNPMLEVMMKPGDYKTVHDVIRFIHEISVREVFRFGGKDQAGATHHLWEPGLPLQFRVIDIGDGLNSAAVLRRNITVSDIVSAPFLALWEGMTCEDVSWSGPAEFNLGGFFSVVSRGFVQNNLTEKGGKAYVLLSKDYLNFHSRLAYHFTVIDTLMKRAPENNYLTFRFGGGGADINGRIQRALLLEEILQRLDFQVHVVGDTVTSHFRGGSREGIQERLHQLGRIMGFTRQLDMALKDDKTRKCYVDDFL